MRREVHHRCVRPGIASLIGAVSLTAALAPTSPMAQADPIDDIVAEVSETVYTDNLDNKLFTHMGDSRGRNGAEHDLARTNIFDAFQSYGLDTYLDPFSYRSQTYYNVVGIHHGLTNPDQMYIVGAHYDSVDNPGADDNASGVAGVMESARILSQYDFDATLIFIAFDLEELGLIGSEAYATEHRNDDIRGMISLDMIAYNPTGQDTVKIYGRSASDPIKQAVRAAMWNYGTLDTDMEGGLDASDHAPFEWEGFDACLVIEYDVWNNPHYHRSTDSVDTPNYIDYDYATRVTRGTVGYLAEAAGLISEPTYSLADPMPGVSGMSNEFSISNATPGLKSFFVYGMFPGDKPVPGCPGLNVEIFNPRIFGKATADANGEMTMTKFVPASVSGFTVFMQATEPGSCQVTNLVQYTFQ